MRTIERELLKEESVSVVRQALREKKMNLKAFVYKKLFFIVIDLNYQ